jgi:hypothetical protein
VGLCSVGALSHSSSHGGISDSSGISGNGGILVNTNGIKEISMTVLGKHDGSEQA